MSINLLDEKIMTKKRFNTAVESVVADKKLSYLDAINYVIEKRGMDYSNIKKLLSDSLKQKVEEEARSLNLLRTKSGNKLPI